METSLPRTFCISRSGSDTRSLPSSLTEPPVTWPTLGSSFMIDKPVVDFPQPDSPTRPTHSPSATLKDTPSTAFTFAERR